VIDARQERRFARQVKKNGEPTIKSESCISILTTKDCHNLNHIAFNAVVGSVLTTNAPAITFADIINSGIQKRLFSYLLQTPNQSIMVSVSSLFASCMKSIGIDFSKVCFSLFREPITTGHAAPCSLSGATFFQVCVLNKTFCPKTGITKAVVGSKGLQPFPTNRTWHVCALIRAPATAGQLVLAMDFWKVLNESTSGRKDKQMHPSNSPNNGGRPR
jgi:hypothetical protein